jgi:hypothetical protein
MALKKGTNWRHYLPERNSTVSLPFACFECRKVFKRRVEFRQPTEKKQVCSQCGRALWFTGNAFRAPSLENAQQWQKAETLIRNGVLFLSNWGYRPTALREVAPFLKSIRVKSPGGRLLARLKRVRQKKAVSVKRGA